MADVPRERYEKVCRFAEAALDRPASERRDFVRTACADDASLAEEVLRLLDAHEELTHPDAEVQGTRIGAYRLIREIGQGGMGSVYVAERADGTYQKQVAIKLIRPDADVGMVVARFSQEQRILAALDHPNIARLIDAGVADDGRPYIVMEYVDGLAITVHCDRARLSVPERIGLFRIVCSAVQHAHQQLVVHRDLKPSNVLVTGDGAPKLLDFGIAKLLTTGGRDAAVLTAPSLRPGTPAYASPEQIAGEPTHTSADVYGLGILLYELLTGRLPFGTDADVQQSESRRQPLPPSKVVAAAAYGVESTLGRPRWLEPAAVSAARRATPRGLVHELEGDLDAIALAALRTDPRQRYRSVAEFSEDLLRHLTHLPVLAHAPSLAYHASKFVKRHRTGIAAATLVVLSLTAGLAGTVYQWQRAERLRQQAERRFDNVRGLADSVFQIERTIAALPENQDARRLLVESSLQYLGRLEQQASDDPALLREVAAGYRKAGDALGSPKGGSLGKAEAAMQTYRKAVATSERAMKVAPSDPAVQRDLSLTLVAMGDLLDAQNDPAGAEAHYRRAQAVAESIAVKYPEDSQVRRDLAAIAARLREASGPGSGDAREEDSYYDGIKDSNDPARLEYFLTLYPSGKYATVVRARLDGLRARKGRTSRSGAALRPESIEPLPPAVRPASMPGVTALGASLEWRRIPAGEFEMGCDLKTDRQCREDERPLHRVTISRSFDLMVTEVTVGEYRAFAGITGVSVPPQPAWNLADNYPVTGVKWEQAMAFCAAAGGRLPTEAEWEYAARGGRQGAYPWGDQWDRTRGNAGFPGRDGWDKTAPVKTFAANSYGLFDMAGNVWEWAADWYDASYYHNSPGQDPRGPSGGGSRVLRGGSFQTSPAYLRASQRGTEPMDRTREATGFRCARDTGQ